MKNVFTNCWGKLKLSELDWLSQLWFPFLQAIGDEGGTMSLSYELPNFSSRVLDTTVFEYFKLD